MNDAYTVQPDLAGKAKNVVRDVKAKALDLTDDVTRAAKDNAAQLGEAALDLANSAKDKVEHAVTLELTAQRQPDRPRDGDTGLLLGLVGRGTQMRRRHDVVELEQG